MGVADFLLYRLARALSSSDVAHSPAMKNALETVEAHAAYRAAAVDLVLDAATRFGIDLANRDVLDLGCNDGALTVQYARKGPRSVQGVDIDHRAVERARVERSHPRVTYCVSTPTQLPIADSSVDVILCYDVFEHVANPPAMLAECGRVLRSGGQLLIGTWGWGNPFAPHLWSTMPIPWVHLLVSERTLLRACGRVYRDPRYRPTRHDFDAEGRRIDRYTETSISAGYLNKYFVRDFERVFTQSGLHWRLELIPFRSRWARWTRPFVRMRRLREFMHGYLWAVLTKPVRRG